MDRFIALGVIKNKAVFDDSKVNRFTETLNGLRSSGHWTRRQLIDLFNEMIPEFNHKETGKFLDGRM